VSHASNKSENEATAASIAQVEQELGEAAAQRRRVFPRAALVGLLVGLAAVAFRFTLDQAQAARIVLTAYAHHFGSFGFLPCAVVSAVVAGAGVYLVQRVAPEAAGSGIPHLQAVLHGWKTLEPLRVLPVKFVGGAMAIGAGLGLGREGPSVQMGGAIAQIVARKTGAYADETRALLAAGAGAGLAAAFNAPLAGMIFVLEEIQRDFSPLVFAAGFVACIVGDIVTRVLMGTEAAFHIVSPDAPPNAVLPLFAILGLVAGLVGIFFNRALMGSLAFVDARPYLNNPRGLALLAALAGFVVGAIGYFEPHWVGSGHHLAELTLNGKLLLAIIPFLFLLRFVVSIGSYATGAAGGIFAPLLGLGALLGLGFAQSCVHFLPVGLIEPRAFAIVGMAAFFTAIVRAPLTGIVLIAEMTGGYELLLPLSTACFTSYCVAEWLRDLPIYEALLERSLRKPVSQTPTTVA
jgi:CIC family chloride channel protein